MIVIIDNYDSFTFNIVQTLSTVPPTAFPVEYIDWQAPEIKVYRNDKISVAEIEEMQPERLIISPGPCTPNEAGISVESIVKLGGKFPILGICLGHQSIGAAFGGNVIRAERLMHGKTSMIRHDDKGVFTGLDNPFEAMRYHSLIIEESSMPDCLEATAYSEQGELMGVRHKELAIEGVQFHPESIMTGEGLHMLHTFLRKDYQDLLH